MGGTGICIKTSLYDASSQTAAEVSAVKLYPVYTIEQTSSKHQAGLMEPRPLAQM